jgi:hypothetical protein
MTVNAGSAAIRRRASTAQPIIPSDPAWRAASVQAVAVQVLGSVLARQWLLEVGEGQSASRQHLAAESEQARQTVLRDLMRARVALLQGSSQ